MMKMIEVMQEEEGMIFVAMDGGEPEEVESAEAAGEMVMQVLSGGMGEDDAMEGMEEMTEEAQIKAAMPSKEEGAEFAGGFNAVRNGGM
jgi:hypothetical protein